MENIILQKQWVQGAAVVPDDLRGTAFTGENGAHTFRVTGIDANQDPVAITGTITGKFLAANNVTVPLTGSIDDGAAVLTLTEDCYAVPGRFIVSIFATNDDTTLCIYCGVGNVFRTESSIVAYPSASIPDIQELIDEAQAVSAQVPGIVSAAQTAVDGIEDQKNTMIASIASVAGQGTDTTLTQSGVAADAKATGDQISSLKSAMYNIFDDATWQLVLIDTTDGKTWSSNNKYLTCLRLPVVAGQILTIAGNATYGSRVMVYFYDTDYGFLNVSDEYVRGTNESTTVTIPQSGYIRVRLQSYSQNTLTDALQAVYKALPSLYISTKALNDKINDNTSDISNISSTLATTTETANSAESGVVSLENQFGNISDVLPTYKETATGTSSNGFWDVGNDTWTASANFDTLTVDYDSSVGSYLYTGYTPNQLVAGATFLDSNNSVIGYALKGKTSGNTPYTDQPIGLIPDGTSKIAFTTYTAEKTLEVKKQFLGLAYTNKAFVIQGDSIETESAGKWPVMLKNAITFGSYTNCAVGGTCIAAVGSNYISSDARMALMPETADVVLVGGGTNDWGNNVPMGTLDDLSSNANFAGAVYSLITKLQTKYPSAYIIFMSNQTGCSPNRTGFEDTSGWINNLGYTMSDYADMLESVCKFAAIPYIDVNHECGINRLNYNLYNLQETNQNNDTVYVHPNEAGAKRMFRVIYNWFKNNAPTE